MIGFCDRAVELEVDLVKSSITVASAAYISREL